MASMKRLYVVVNDELADWLIEQAKLNHRSKNKQIEYLLDSIRLTASNHYPLQDEKWIKHQRRQDDASYRDDIR